MSTSDMAYTLQNVHDEHIYLSANACQGVQISYTKDLYVKTYQTYLTEHEVA